MISRILYYYYRSAFLKYHLNTREKLIAYQNKAFNQLVKKTLIKSPFYKEFLSKPLDEWPIINKQMMNDHFDQINTAQIKRSDALNLALKAEETRDFSLLINNIAVGLSSGTSGNRGLFLANAKERDAWAGIILAKILPFGFKQPERIAFFLRANSPLYTTVNKSKKIQFHFFDLMGDLDEQISRLNKLQPTILTAPSSVLRILAQEKNRLTISPRKVVAVAEVLEHSDEQLIQEAFKQPVSQVYQCTEGFLAISDKKSNNLVLNEEFIIIEKEWIDKQRFVPIITDLLRTTQPIIRYRLDDILIAKESTGVFTELSGIEGRLGDVCYAKKGEHLIPVFADSIRQYMARSPIDYQDYFICQNTPDNFTIQVHPEPGDKEKLITHLNQLFLLKGCELPTWSWEEYKPRDKSSKQRRIQSKISQ